jgi:hypothetical protein
MSAGTFRRRCGFETQRPLKGCFQQSQPSGWLFYWRDRLPVRYATWRSWASPRSTSAVTEGNCGNEKRPVRGAGRSHQESGDGGFRYWKAGPRVQLARSSLLFAANESANRLYPELLNDQRST